MLVCVCAVLYWHLADVVWSVLALVMLYTVTHNLLHTVSFSVLCNSCRRWNNTVSLTLRSLIYDPIVEGTWIHTQQPTASAAAAGAGSKQQPTSSSTTTSDSSSRSSSGDMDGTSTTSSSGPPAAAAAASKPPRVHPVKKLAGTAATFAVSGIMHEFILLYALREGNSYPAGFWFMFFFSQVCAACLCLCLGFCVVWMMAFVWCVCLVCWGFLSEQVLKCAESAAGSVNQRQLSYIHVVLHLFAALFCPCLITPTNQPPSLPQFNTGASTHHRGHGASQAAQGRQAPGSPRHDGLDDRYSHVHCLLLLVPASRAVHRHCPACCHVGECGCSGGGWRCAGAVSAAEAASSWRCCACWQCQPGGALSCIVCVV